ncbi:MAG: MoxR family ATPase [Firmicutes bacterium]|jgi:MoxR-like ATPase|nr:MoxR family ATPase [Bacillota bacterium]
MTELTINSIAEFGQTVADNIGRVIVGKRREVYLILTALLSGGHVLLEDVPGVGKTMLARALAKSIGGRFSRIQCTPDLLPSDITGVSVFNQKQGDFVFHPGPIMAQVVLADEINRATPRTQSSLLEAMGEMQVTVDGVTYPLAAPFLVIATQNPIEYEGTFPLPEAQLDRFFMRIHLGYPSVSEEKAILQRLQVEHPIEDISACTSLDEVAVMQRLVCDVFVEESVRDYIVRLTHASRSHPQVQLGASPRGSLALMRASQASAALQGRDYVIPDDVKGSAMSVLAHRLLLRPESVMRGVTAEAIVGELLERVAVGAEPRS